MTRFFNRPFLPGIEIRSAALENGLMRVDLAPPQIREGVRVNEINGDKS